MRKGKVEKILKYKREIEVKVLGVRLGIGEVRGKRIRVMMVPKNIEGEEWIKVYKERG